VIYENRLVRKWDTNGSLHNGVRSEVGMLVISDHFPDSAGLCFEAVFGWQKERDPMKTH
jgi:hypothetical protein